MSAPTPARRCGRNRFLAAGALALAGTLLVALPGAAQAKPRHKQKSAKVTVMTRNLYLGADLGPAISATGFADFIEKNGQILRDVDTNNFQVRARGLAKEILSKRPDLVGLQEVAVWRIGLVNLPAALAGGCRKAKAAGNPCTATTVKYDFLKLLLGRLNKGKQALPGGRGCRGSSTSRRPPTTTATRAPADRTGDIDGRLTMRDAILARVGAGVHTSRARSGNFKTVYEPTVSGVKVPVDRGWLSVDARVRHSRKFRFIDTHLEAFGDPAIRAAQAKELFPGRAAPARRGCR